MLTLADIPCNVPDAEAIAYIESTIDPRLFVPFVDRSWPGFGLAGVTWPVGYRPTDKIRLNRFVWPRGASRFAYGHFLADSEQSDQIRDAALSSDGSQTDQIQLVMDSPRVPPDTDNDETLTTNVYLLSCTPLYTLTPQPNGPMDNGLYLLTVVCPRYYWWYIPTPVFGITDSTTWTSLFSACNTALGLTIAVDTIDTRYLNPSPGLNLDYEVLPPVLDAIAYNVGHRIVYGLDGTVKSQSFSRAVTARQTDAQNHPNRDIRAGGNRFVNIL